MKKLNLKQINKFWTKQALRHGQSPLASWSDQPAIDMEIRQLIKYLENGDKVLDIGCGNGYSTFQLAAHKRINIKGIDNIPEMIANANLRLKNSKIRLAGKVNFKVGDITDLDESTASYDKVITTRVLINLGNWNNQLAGLKECCRVLKKGGVLLLSEATLQGWRQLNKFRKEWGLTEIAMPPFNSYLDQDKVVKAVRSYLKLSTIVNFASTYYIGTRVLKPLLIKALKSNIDAADPGMEWNRWFAQLPSGGDYGTQKLFIFKKI